MRIEKNTLSYIKEKRPTCKKKRSKPLDSKSKRERGVPWAEERDADREDLGGLKRCIEVDWRAESRMTESNGEYD